eukprot:GHVT01096055.1.p1 GENE.GHVT01096055.1~~GHVT01096055.1.p1  ORF type:complete len:110 (+),score=14.91 GHVT01096055.1:287-616(+)
MGRLRWRNASCSDTALRFMEVAVQQLEVQLLQYSRLHADKPRADQPHIPTLINDLLYEYCVAVAVSANAGDGSCFRGMECAQFETMGKVYDIAILLAPNLKRAAGEAEP